MKIYKSFFIVNLLKRVFLAVCFFSGNVFSSIEDFLKNDSAKNSAIKLFQKKTVASIEEFVGALKAKREGWFYSYTEGLDSSNKIFVTSVLKYLVFFSSSEDTDSLMHSESLIMYNILKLYVFEKRINADRFKAVLMNDFNKFYTEQKQQAFLSCLLLQIQAGSKNIIALQSSADSVINVDVATRDLVKDILISFKNIDQLGFLRFLYYYFKNQGCMELDVFEFEGFSASCWIAAIARASIEDFYGHPPLSFSSTPPRTKLSEESELFADVTNLSTLASSGSSISAEKGVKRRLFSDEFSTEKISSPTAIKA